MEFVVLLAIVLLGSIVESAFAFLFAGFPPKGAQSPLDVKTDARYDRLSAEFGAVA